MATLTNYLGLQKKSSSSVSKPLVWFSSLSHPAMSNSRPRRRFCAAQFGFSL